MKIDAALIPKVTLNTGEQIPCIGMGTFGSDRFTPDQVSAAVAGAIRCGYRMFDCASCYQNEDQIGEVFAQAFKEGVVERKDLFIMTKVWNDQHREVAKALKKSIKDLQCDYADMYFIHWPFPNYHAPGCDVDSRNPDSKPFSVAEFMDTYRQCEALVREGLIRNIGISNMTIPKLEAVYDKFEAGGLRDGASSVLPAAGALRLARGTRHSADRIHAARISAETGERYRRHRHRGHEGA